MKRSYPFNPFPLTPTWFTKRAHRWPEEWRPFGYAMACIEVVANYSAQAGEMYAELVHAWGAPELQAFYRDFVASLPDELIEEWKDCLRRPEVALADAMENPLALLSESEVDEVFEGIWDDPEYEPSFEGVMSDAQARAFLNWVRLLLAFVRVGFNPQPDREAGTYRVVPRPERSPLLFAVMYRSGLEYGGVTPARLDRAYKVREVNGKVVDFEEVMAEKPANRRHRTVVKASKKAHMRLQHDYTFLDAATLWYRCRMLYTSVDQYVGAAAFVEENTPDLKNVQKAVKKCDRAVGYMRRLPKIP